MGGGKENFATPTRRPAAVAPPSSALKSKLSAFASPSLLNKECEENGTISGGNVKDVLTFPHLKLTWLAESGIKDKAKRRPDHPDYDASTLHVPEAFLKDQTPAQHQWWKLKAEHFDTVLFFKM